ncbi:hypothetical protein DEDE109153_08730 [Deinococcus deserti]
MTKWVAGRAYGVYITSKIDCVLSIKRLYGRLVKRMSFHSFHFFQKKALDRAQRPPVQRFQWSLDSG